ncbi:hypothetical protein QN277_020954 [Acacia crassicarpa]|uniref:Uncharacterized protein n=1 Tax=Acacia crassicarpa TaxID=499986 RepID=A0AAE1JMN9_9FABA|nr:hypothetical protein QN277_020954 [Acacia crassicarpa]
MSLKYGNIRSAPGKFGISFTVPDRVTAEITGKKTVMGRHPMRISRIPSGGPPELHKLVEEAEKGSLPLTLHKRKGGLLNKMTKKKKLDYKRAYHRSRFNDWYVEVFYFDNCSETQASDETQTSDPSN